MSSTEWTVGGHILENRKTGELGYLVTIDEIVLTAKSEKDMNALVQGISDLVLKHTYSEHTGTTVVHNPEPENDNYSFPVNTVGLA